MPSVLVIRTALTSLTTNAAALWCVRPLLCFARVNKDRCAGLFPVFVSFMLFMVETESESGSRAVAIVGVRCFFTMKSMKSMKGNPDGLDYKRGFHFVVLVLSEAVRVLDLGSRVGSRAGFSSWVFDLGRSEPRSWFVVFLRVSARVISDSTGSLFLSRLRDRGNDSDKALCCRGSHGMFALCRCGSRRFFRTKVTRMTSSAHWLWSGPHEPQVTLIQAASKGNSVLSAQIFLLADGDLIATFPHVRYYSDALVTPLETFCMRSRDGGISWNRFPKEELPADFFSVFPDIDPYEVYWQALRLNDGTLLGCNGCAWENFADTPEKRRELADQGYYVFTPEEYNAEGTISVANRYLMQRSTDNGTTWEGRPIPFPRFACFASAYGDPILTRAGTFLKPNYGRFDLNEEPHVSSLVLRTTDGGDNWGVITVAKSGPGPDDVDFDEHSVTEAPNGDIVSVIRRGSQIELWSAISHDDGRTWGAPFDTKLRGSTPAVVTTTDGLLAAVYSRRISNRHLREDDGNVVWPRTGMYACVSRDNGRSWDSGRQVAVFDNDWKYVDGYPMARPMPDGSVYTVFAATFLADEEKAEDAVSAIYGVRFHPLHEAFTAAAADTESPSPAAGRSVQELKDAELRFQIDRRNRLSAADGGSDG